MSDSTLFHLHDTKLYDLSFAKFILCFYLTLLKNAQIHDKAFFSNQLFLKKYDSISVIIYMNNIK